MLVDDKLLSAVGPFAWPIVALIALFVFHPHIKNLTQGVADLRQVLNQRGDLLDLFKTLTTINETVEILNARQALELSAKPAISLTDAVGSASVDELWKRIDAEWNKTKEALRQSAAANGIQATNIGSGTVPLQKVTDALVSAGAIEEPVAAKIVDLSAKWQFLRRTPSDLAKVLNTSVADSFANDATLVRNHLSSRR